MSNNNHKREETTPTLCGQRARETETTIGLMEMDNGVLGEKGKSESETSKKWQKSRTEG